jgi:hypothetical protein
VSEKPSRYLPFILPAAGQSVQFWSDQANEGNLYSSLECFKKAIRKDLDQMAQAGPSQSTLNQ